jgi:hypothetical protein
MSPSVVAQTASRVYIHKPRNVLIVNYVIASIWSRTTGMVMRDSNMARVLLVQGRYWVNRLALSIDCITVQAWALPTTGLVSGGWAIDDSPLATRIKFRYKRCQQSTEIVMGCDENS